MTRSPARTHFPSSRLIRILSDLALMDAAEPGAAFAEKLGLWVDYSDAIALSTALTPSAESRADARRGDSSAAGAVVSDQLTRLRTGFLESITHSGSAQASRARIERPVVDFELPVKVSIAFDPYRRYYGAHQREMDSTIRTLRAGVRDVLTRASMSLRHLAALDAALEKVLCEREGKLLSTVPLLLRKRFEHLLKAHQQTLNDNRQVDDSATWMEPGGWLARFFQELQTVLIAELDVRLQPTAGLIEALQNEKK
jgi:hypothetical protein